MKAPLVEANHWRRAWLLSILDGAARAGLTPIHQMLVHRAAFLSNALAPVYQLPIENGLVTRWKRGPYFPELQWDLDRLAMVGLAAFIRVRPARDEDGWWFENRYSLGPKAVAFLEAAAFLPSFARAHRFHSELLAAIANLPDRDRDDAAIEDASYANIVDGDLDESETVIDFAQWRDRNFSTRATATIEGHLEELPRVDERMRIHLYLRYLGRRASRERRLA